MIALREQPRLRLQPGAIGDTVWWDLNANGVKDSGESGIANASVVLSSTNASTRTNVTDQNGYYLFTALPSNGTYTITLLTNTFSGGLILDGGFLFLGSTNGSLGTGPLTVNSMGGIGPTNAVDQNFANFLNQQLPATGTLVNLMMLVNSANDMDWSALASLTNTYLSVAPGRVVTYTGAINPAKAARRSANGPAGAASARR